MSSSCAWALGGMTKDKEEWVPVARAGDKVTVTGGMAARCCEMLRDGLRAFKAAIRV